MDFKSLKYAIALADTGSFIRAANKLSLTQSAVSRSIITLEEDMGVPLFDRTTTGVFPTKAGNIFIHKARKIVSETQALKQEVKKIQAEISGELAFGAVPAVAASYFPRILTQLITTAPSLQTSLKIDVSGVLANLLDQEKIEFFIGIIDDLHIEPRFSHDTLGELKGYGVYCRPEHPLTLIKNISNQNLLNYPISVAGFEKKFERALRNLLQLNHGDQFPLHLVCDNLFILQRVVAHSDALLITSQSAVIELINSGELVRLPITNFDSSEPATHVVMISLKGRSLSPAAEYIADQLRNQL